MRVQGVRSEDIAIVEKIAQSTHREKAALWHFWTEISAQPCVGTAVLPEDENEEAPYLCSLPKPSRKGNREEKQPHLITFDSSSSIIADRLEGPRRVEGFLGLIILPPIVSRMRGLSTKKRRNWPGVTSDGSSPCTLTFQTSKPSSKGKCFSSSRKNQKLPPGCFSEPARTVTSANMQSVS